MAKKFVEPEYDVYKVDEVDLVLERDFYIVGNNKITSSSSAVEIFRQFWNENLINIQEQFSVMLLNQSNKVIGMYQHSKGAINSTIGDVELIAAVAVKSLAKGVIVAHNHPSGALTPSEADIKLTKRLKNALALFQINLLDSVIIVQDKTNYYSLLDSGDFADGGIIVGDNSVKEEYIIKDGSNRYYARGLSSGNVKFNDSQDMAYMFNKGEAESIKKKLELEGFSNLSVEKYDKDWWKKMAKGGATKDKKYFSHKQGGMMNGGLLDVGKYYMTKSGKQVRYLGKTKDPEVGTFTNKTDGVSKIRYNEIEGKASLFGKGGYMAKGGKTDGIEWDKDSDGYRAELGSFKINISPSSEKGYWNVYVFEGKKSVGKEFDVYGINMAKDKAYDIISNQYKMAMGGKTFEGKVKSIKKSLLERKKVPKSVQKDYGKTFSPKEAEDSAKRIVGSLTARERMKSKMKK